MKFTILVASGMLIATLNTTYADQYIRNDINEAYTAESYAGDTCSQAGAVFFVCKNGGNGLNITEECGINFGNYGCKMPGGTTNVFCTYAHNDTSHCSVICGWGNSSDAWTADSANRVTRASFSMNSPYICTQSTPEYGCAANYYQKSGSGASMVCDACPQSGKNANGSTDIATCYQPSGSAFSDTYGSGTYTANCYYSK